MTTITTNANGTYSDCGYGLPVAVTITCAGSSCPSLQSYPDLTCTTDATTTNCNNGVTCPGTPNFQSVFKLLQQGLTVTTNQNLTVTGQDFSGTDTGNGLPVSFSNIGPTPTTSVAGCPIIATTATIAHIPVKST